MLKAKSAVISLLLAACVVAGVFAGCGSTPSQAPVAQSSAAPAASAVPSDAPAAEPVKASGTVKMLSPLTGGKDEAEMKQFEKALSEATGLEVIVERPPSDYNQLLMQKLQAGEKYDMIYIGMDQYKELIAQGALTDLTDWAESSSIYQNNVSPQELDDIRVDGKIYAGFNKLELHRVVALNKVMLEAAGIDYKTIEPTLDGYYEVMKKLKAANPDPDFYPYNAVMWETWDLQPWMAAAGLKNGPILDSDGKTFASYARDEAAPVWEWFKKLYDEKLLDPGSFVDTAGDMRSKMGAASKKTAITVDWAMWVGIHNANAKTDNVSTDEFEIVSLPGVKNPNGDYMLCKGGASLFGVPTNAENPDGAKAILEFFATQEGGEMLSVGVEGYDYNIENGKYVQTEIGATHSNDHGAPRPIFKDFQHPIGYNLGVEEALQYLPYATIDYAIAGSDTEFRRAQGKWYVQIIKGEIGVLEGLAECRKEVVALGFVDK